MVRNYYSASAKLLFLFVLLCVGMLNHAAAERGSQLPLIFTSHLKEIVPETHFSCGGSVFAYLTLPHDYNGTHQIEGVWRRPDGGIQDRSQFPVDLKAQGNHQVYVWLNFKEDSSLKELNLGFSRSPEKNEFDGRWTLEVLADQKPIARSAFDVSCP